MSNPEYDKTTGSNRKIQSTSAPTTRDRDPAAACPLAYLITFTTYGTWLHGDERGWTDPKHNTPGTAYPRYDEKYVSRDQRGLKHRPVLLNAQRRRIVHDTIQQVCHYKGWELCALHVRSNHVHLVVCADPPPERIMNAVKSWATRRMVEHGVLASGIKAWTRHGSTRYLWRQPELEAACHYVCEGQGLDLPMP